MKFIFLLCVFVMGCLELQANDNAGSWLTVVPDARAVALGNAQVAIASGPFAAFHNPAGIGKKGSVAFSNVCMFEQYNSNYGSLVYPSDLGSLGLSYYLQGIGGIKTTTYVSGRPVDLNRDFSAANSALALTWASDKLVRSLNVGVTVKLISEKLGSDTASGVGADLGVQMTPTPGFVIGGAIYNLMSPRISYGSGTDTYASRIKVGIGYACFDDFLLAVDTEFSMATDKLRLMLGVEYQPTQNLAFRLGTDDNTLDVGMGLTLYGIEMSGAYSIQTRYKYMDSSYRFSLQVL